MINQFPKEFNKIVEDIKHMKIRGAGRIARAAAAAIKIVVQNMKFRSRDSFLLTIKNAAKVLINTRPTAVSLPNSIRYILNNVINDYKNNLSLDELIYKAISYSDNFIINSLLAIKKIGEYGSNIIEDGYTILTHCNSTTAINIITHAARSGKSINVYVTETRPKFQGRITAKFLDKVGIDVTLIIDSAVNYYINEIDITLVGADAILSDGSVINKIGTSQIAIISKNSNIPFYVAAETYKFSPESVFGERVIIEERGPFEVVPERWLKQFKHIKVKNPSFDITYPQYITSIISEIGVYSPIAFPHIASKHLKIDYSNLRPWL